mmetsp:Transcript_82190/g.197070  ORF Transcript_82190/g.197070 Transcript_82190/m.197070 type:complete len:205 (+) Transcript_82190:273-887(+)
MMARARETTRNQIGRRSKLPSSTAAAKITQQTFGAAWLTRTTSLRWRRLCGLQGLYLLRCWRDGQGAGERRSSKVATAVQALRSFGHGRGQQPRRRLFDWRRNASCGELFEVKNLWKVRAFRKQLSRLLKLFRLRKAIIFLEPRTSLPCSCTASFPASRWRRLRQMRSGVFSSCRRRKPPRRQIAEPNACRSCSAPSMNRFVRS